MRVISGTLKGRVIKNKKIEGTRPTMDRVKESLFAMLSPYLENSVFLDLFAGSGSIGIEAISNQALHCYFVDKNKLCIQDIKHTIQSFEIQDRCTTLLLDYMQALKYFNEHKIRFDILFLDPPYKEDIYENIITYVLECNLLNKEGLLICETIKDHLKEKYNHLRQIKKKKYGDKYVIIYKLG